MSKQMKCTSCNHKEATHSEEAGLPLCDVCRPWVEHSLKWTADIPTWSRSFSHRREDLFEETRKALLQLAHAGRKMTDEKNTEIEGRHWNPTHHAVCVVPNSEWGWIHFLQWVLCEEIDGLDPEDLSISQYHCSQGAAVGAKAELLLHVQECIQKRREMVGTAFSVSRIRNQLSLMDENTEHIAGHSVRLHGNSVWVADVLFGPNAHDVHCQTTRILPHVMFERYHGLDTRPIEELAYAYMRGPWIQLIGQTTSARVPSSLGLREAISRIADGAFGDEPADRIRASLLLWTTVIELEFLTCPPSAWARSFQWVREIAEENPDLVRVSEDGIYVDGSSKNQYRISPTACSLDRFEVRKVVSFPRRIGTDMTDSICIHSITDDEEGPNRPLGDVVVNLILALLDDLHTAEKIPQLYRHLPAEFQTRRRTGDRRHWREWRNLWLEMHPEAVGGPDNREEFREWMIAARAARARAEEE